jgi:hypothetical protein
MQSDFVQVALPSSPKLIKKRQASQAQRSMIGHGSKYKSAWQNQPNSLYPYSNAANMPLHIRDVLNVRPVKTDDAEPSALMEEGEDAPQLKSQSKGVLWSPTAAWSSSPLPTRNTGGCISLSRSRSPFFEKNSIIVN